MNIKLRHGLIGQWVGDELLIYDEPSRCVHALREPAASVYEAAQTHSTLESLKAALTAFSSQELEHALFELKRADLVIFDEAPRRKFLKSVAAVALVATVALPKPSAADSGPLVATCVGLNQCQTGGGACASGETQCRTSTCVAACPTGGDGGFCNTACGGGTNAFYYICVSVGTSCVAPFPTPSGFTCP